jgi:hypothetical protein
MLFGIIELSLFFIGHYVIQPYSEQGEVLICVGELQVIWKEKNQFGVIFSTVHKLILSLSAGAVIKNFYLVPRSNGLIKKFEFPDEMGLNESVLSFSSETALITNIQE